MIQGIYSGSIVVKPDFSEQFKKISNRYNRIRIRYNIDTRQTSVLMINQVQFNNFAVLFNCTTMCRAADSMTAQNSEDDVKTKSLNFRGCTGLWYSIFKVIRMRSMIPKRT